MCMVVILIAIALISYLGAEMAKGVTAVMERQQAQYTEILDEAVPLGGN